MHYSDARRDSRERIERAAVAPGIRAGIARAPVNRIIRTNENAAAACPRALQRISREHAPLRCFAPSLFEFTGGGLSGKLGKNARRRWRCASDGKFEFESSRFWFLGWSLVIGITGGNRSFRAILESSGRSKFLSYLILSSHREFFASDASTCEILKFVRFEFRFQSCWTWWGFRQIWGKSWCCSVYGELGTEIRTIWTFSNEVNSFTSTYFTRVSKLQVDH